MVTGIFFNFLSEGELLPPPPQKKKKKKKKHFYQNEGVPPVSREHVHTGRPHLRINNNIFNKPNVISFQ